MYDNLSALNAYSDGMAITAHNIANMNTDGFKNWSFNYGAGPSGQVEVQQVGPSPSFGGNDTVSLSPGADSWRESVGLIDNTVDVGRQSVNMMVAEQGFEANAVTIAARAETGDTVLGLVVDRRA